VGKSPIGNQFGPYSPDRASSWSLTRGAQPVGLFGSGRHGFPVARVSKAQRSEWLPGTTEGGSCTPPQHSTRHVTSGTIPHHTPVAWRGSALLRVIRPWPVTQDWTGRTSQATGRNGRAGETEANPGCVSVTIGRARHALRNSARLSPLRNKLDARLPLSASASFRPLRRESRQRFVWKLKLSAAPPPSSHFQHVKTRTIFGAFLALGR
jgi:hypothetical protein